MHDRTKRSVLLVADFGRLRPDQGSLTKDVVIPYVHRVPTFSPRDEGASPPERNLLLFFAGNRFRKEVRFASRFCAAFTGAAFLTPSGFRPLDDGLCSRAPR